MLGNFNRRKTLYLFRGLICALVLVIAIAFLSSCENSQNDHSDVINADPASESDSSYKPAESDHVNLDSLQGMYVGYRVDYGGEECGGLCSDIYTFLPNNMIVIGYPVNGGPEFINCKVDNCYPYEVNNGKMLVNDESYDITVENSFLTINGVTLEHVDPVGKNVTLLDAFEHRGYTGTGLVGSYTTSWTQEIDFKDDGTFESSFFRLGSLDTSIVVTHGLNADDDSGTYTIDDNTIVFTYDSGDTERFLFFKSEHEDPEYSGIQIGEQVYYYK